MPPSDLFGFAFLGTSEGGMLISMEDHRTFVGRTTVPVVAYSRLGRPRNLQGLSVRRLGTNG